MTEDRTLDNCRQVLVDAVVERWGERSLAALQPQIEETAVWLAAMEHADPELSIWEDEPYFLAAATEVRQ